MTFDEWFHKEYEPADLQIKQYAERKEGLHIPATCYLEDLKKAFEAGLHADVHTDNSKVIAELEEKLANADYFEKEAEEYRKNFNYNQDWHGQVIDKSPSLIVEQSFQDGAEFGYNKANEEAKEIINELLMNGYDESTRAKALDFLYPDKE